MGGAQVRLKANCRADAGRLRMAKVRPARIIELQLGQDNELKAEKTEANPISEGQPVEGALRPVAESPSLSAIALHKIADNTANSAQ
jgi:hypothetical protein